MLNRRQFVGAASALCAGRIVSGPGSLVLAADEPDEFTKSIAGQVGVTTSSLSGHLVSKPGKDQFSLLELPRILRDELDMKVIDLNTSSVASYEPAYLEKVREAARDADCVLTNLKLNQKGLDMNSPDADVRKKALSEYKKSIEAASKLGCRWARPLPLQETPDMTLHIAAYRELADFAAERDMKMLVENYQWMESDPNSVVTLIRKAGHGIEACPDTGNWKDNDTRYAGLKATFPIAVSCDFKARAISADGSHPLYDLKRCFTIGWEAGYRGPLCLEHANADRVTLFKELALLRDQLRGWMKKAA
ncbi:MAG: TIM barrel protein [Planctomycetota bacterium]|nr:TIM barrel protein [Planctomycetota bacterium]MDA1247760.1 TIM barrel protein [Planctomycetota bacterium]